MTAFFPQASPQQPFNILLRCSTSTCSRKLNMKVESVRPQIPPRNTSSKFPGSRTRAQKMKRNTNFWVHHGDLQRYGSICLDAIGLLIKTIQGTIGTIGKSTTYTKRNACAWKWLGLGKQKRDDRPCLHNCGLRSAKHSTGAAPQTPDLVHAAKQLNAW